MSGFSPYGIGVVTDNQAVPFTVRAVRSLASACC